MKTQRYFHNKSIKRGRTKVIQDTPQNEQQFDPGLFSKFKRFINDQRLRELKMRLHQFYGKNFAINYRASYNFYEEWQNEKQKIYDKSELQVINTTFLGSLISVLIMVIFSLSIWTCNIDQFFSSSGEIAPMNQEIHALALIAQVMDICIKMWYNTSKEKEKKEILVYYFFKLCYQNVICIIYLLLHTTGNTYESDWAWICFEIIAQFMMYWRAKKIYESFHYVKFALKYQYQFKAFDLILNLLIFAHFISIVLFSVTKLNPDQNWFEVLNLQNPTEYTKYIYSFYFCTTTILTVGYGDISPKNPTEVVMVTCLQVFGTHQSMEGIIIFGYMVNEIGYNLSALRKQSEAVKRELNLVEKMRKYYRIDDDLIHKARAYLINREPESDQLSPQEETGLMTKFNEELRNQIMNSTSLSIVKSSIFFLCRWSKSMQNSVASRLIHALFSPGEQLYQPEGKERIYLIRLGKVDVYTERRGNRLGNKSILKELAIGLDKEVSDNCYGYTAVISARPVRLYAISKDYTSAYYVEKQKFHECINNKSTDFEYFHEIKSRIDQSQLWQSLQVPSLSNSKHHYCPTRLHIIQKGKKQSLHSNERIPFYRQHKKLFRGGNILHDPEQLSNIHRIFIPSLQDSNLDDTIKRTKNNNNSIHSIQKITTMEDIQNLVQSFDIKKLFHHYFEAAKEYSNFFINQNLEEILKRYENHYFFTQSTSDHYDISLKTYFSQGKQSFYTLQ